MRIPARAKFDFVGESEKEYSMKKGQSIIVTKQIDDNWCQVESVNGKKSGIIPTSYVEVSTALPVTINEMILLKLLARSGTVYY